MNPAGCWAAPESSFPSVRRTEVRGLLIVLLVAACQPSPVEAKAPSPAAPAPPPEQVEAPAPPPKPEGDSLIVEQFPCVYMGCPAFRMEVFRSGHVRWLGIEFVSAAGERAAAIDPARAQALLERWDTLPLEDIPATSEEATQNPHQAVRCVSRTSDVGAIRRCAVLSIVEWSSDSPAAALDAFASEIERSAKASNLMRSDCYGFSADSVASFERRVRVGDGISASTLARSYFRDPDHSVIRIVVAQRATANRVALALREELLESGVPLRAVRYERVALPSGVFEEVGWRYLILGNPLRRDWGWAGVVTSECLEASRPSSAVGELVPR